MYSIVVHGYKSVDGSGDRSYYADPLDGIDYSYTDKWAMSGGWNWTNAITTASSWIPISDLEWLMYDTFNGSVERRGLVW
jgi:hypothetical protein